MNNFIHLFFLFQYNFINWLLRFKIKKIIQYFHFLTQNSDFQVLKFIYLDHLQYFNVSFQFILKFSFNFRILLINLKIFLNYFIIY